MASEIIIDTDRLHICIGKIVVKFQLIENVIAEILASLLQMRESEDIHRVTAAMSYAQKLNLMCDLYDDRKNPKRPPINIESARNALMSAETFRNAVVHSLWFVGGEESQWMRAKANLRNGGKLKVITGPANIEALEEAVNCLSVIGDWYLGRSAQLASATCSLNQLTKELSARQSKT
ncbi:hypothetical protein [Methylotenera sp.]|uniref:hypothetical protein n=1 Tax=Methylotenera sp. TaxID=2051956 RepID=UPI002EDA6976